MRRSCMLMVLLLAGLSFVGCSKGPSDKEAAALAFNYLSGVIPGIKETEINLLKPLEIGGQTIVVVYAGGMICHLPVKKGSDGWIAESASCKGQFEPPETAVARRKKAFVARIKNEIDRINKQAPYSINEGKVRFNSAEYSINNAVYCITLLGVQDSECSNKLITEKIKPLIDTYCADSETSKIVAHDISYEYYTYDSNGKRSLMRILNRDICNHRLYCQ